MNGYLQHYGIQGQKWGIRNYQYPDGSLTPAGMRRYGVKRSRRDNEEHTIPKGTKMYRVSTKSAETADGTKYVTYVPVDRDFYRGSYANALAKQQSGDANAKVYEHEFELTDDLKIPSQKTLQQVIAKVSQDEKLRKETAKSLWNKNTDDVDIRLIATEAVLDKAREGGKKTVQELLSNPKTVKKLEKEVNKEIRDMGKKFVDDLVASWDTKSPEFVNRAVSRSYGTSEYNKSKVIEELKKLGYNAMPDNAGIGGQKIDGVQTGREGFEPLLIFEGNSAMKSVSSKEIDDATKLQASKNYNKWSSYANNSKNKSKSWI